MFLVKTLRIAFTFEIDVAFYCILIDTVMMNLKPMSVHEQKKKCFRMLMVIITSELRNSVYRCMFKQEAMQMLHSALSLCITKANITRSEL
jgi:hypothetical protein